MNPYFLPRICSCLGLIAIVARWAIGPLPSYFTKMEKYDQMPQRSSAEKILTLKNRESIHFGKFAHDPCHPMNQFLERFGSFLSTKVVKFVLWMLKKSYLALQNGLK